MLEHRLASWSTRLCSSALSGFVPRLSETACPLACSSSTLNYLHLDSILSHSAVSDLGISSRRESRSLRYLRPIADRQIDSRAMSDALRLKTPTEAMGTASRILSDVLGKSKNEYIRAVKEGRGREWTVVMGNEAGDLDSMASAIGYAWYISTIQGTPAVPLTQTPRGDLHLRAENLHAFSLVGLDPADLLCVDDVPHEKPGPFPATKFALVDHNRLGSQFSLDNPEARVVAIVDHHTDEGLHKDTADPRIVTTGIGSCASLVARYLEEKCPDKLPPELASLLLSSIVIDTSGMIPGGKAVETDILAAGFLASRSSLSVAPDLTISFSTASSVPLLHESPAIRELFDALQTKKNSLSHLHTRDLLRRDYKEYALTPFWAPTREVQIGLASVPMSLASWLPREGKKFASETKEWMDERGLTALGILTSFRDDKKLGKSGKGKHRREQLYVVRTSGKDEEELAERLFDGLEKCGELKLKDRKWKKLGVEEAAGFDHGWRVRVWKQKNTDATRKATAPLVKSIIEGREKMGGLY